MKVKDIIAMVPACDTINLQDSTGNLWEGLCQNFRSTWEDATVHLDREVDCIRAYNSVMIILLAD